MFLSEYLLNSYKLSTECSHRRVKVFGGRLFCRKFFFYSWLMWKLIKYHGSITYIFLNELQYYKNYAEAKQNQAFREADFVFCNLNSGIYWLLPESHRTRDKVVYCFDTHRYRRCYILYHGPFLRTSTCCLSMKRYKQDCFNYKTAARRRYSNACK